jgi:hypothetical protein
MGARKLATRDLATDLATEQAIEERITALRDLVRARRILDAAKASGLYTSIGTATRTMDAALNRAASTRAALEGALHLEAEGRA